MPPPPPPQIEQPRPSCCLAPAKAILGSLILYLTAAVLIPPAQCLYPGSQYEASELMAAPPSCVLTIKPMNSSSSYSTAVVTNSYLTNYVTR